MARMEIGIEASNDKSSYLDSQAFGPGSAFTAEIAYEGGGNRNMADGLYEIHFTPPKAGTYFVFVEVESAGLPFQKSPFLVLTAERQAPSASR